MSQNWLDFTSFKLVFCSQYFSYTILGNGGGVWGGGLPPPQLIKQLQLIKKTIDGEQLITLRCSSPPEVYCLSCSPKTLRGLLKTPFPKNWSTHMLVASHLITGCRFSQIVDPLPLPLLSPPFTSPLILSPLPSLPSPALSSPSLPSPLSPLLPSSFLPFPVFLLSPFRLPLSPFSFPSSPLPYSLVCPSLPSS